MKKKYSAVTPSLLIADDKRQENKNLNRANDKENSLTKAP
jgi:hypothetical protein